MAGQLRFEAWTLPTSATFKRKNISVPALAGASGRKALSEWSDCTLPVPDSWSGLSDLMTSGTMFAVYDGDTWIEDFVAERAPRSLVQPGVVNVTGPTVAGLLSKIGVFPPDYPINPSRRPNWVWAGENILPDLALVDLGNINAEYELYLSGERYELDVSLATAGTYTLTFDGNTTAALAWNASASTIKSELEGLAGITTVTVLQPTEDREFFLVFENPKDLPSNVTADFSALNVAGNLTKLNDGFDTGTNPTWTITINGNTSAAIDWNQSTTNVENLIQGTLGVNDVTVQGSGTSSNPWVIIFFDPPSPSVSVTFAAGTAVLSQVKAGAFSPAPITQSQQADQRIDPALHGTYGDPAIEVVTNNLDTGADWALLVNALSQFAGSQIVLSVIPGEIYQASIRVKPTVAGKYRLVIRDIFEGLIKATDPFEVALTAGTYQTLTVEDIVIPAGVTMVVMRVAVVSASLSEIGDFYVNWQGAEFTLGLPPANPGHIVITLLEHAQERGVGTWLDPTFDATLDSAGAAWPQEYSYQADGFAMYLSHVMADMADLTCEWSVTRKATPSGGLTHDLNLWLSGNAGTDRVATGPSLLLGGSVVGGQVVNRLPAFTVGVAWGADDLFGEDADATALSTFGRWERLFDAEQYADLASLEDFLDEQLDDDATNRTAGAVALSGSGSVVPFVHFGIGDTLVWQAPGRMDKQERRVQTIEWRSGAPSAEYSVQGSRVWEGEAALWKAVERLIDEPKKRRRFHPLTPVLQGRGGGIPDVVLAAADTKYPNDADLLASAFTSDDLMFQAALDLLPAQGGWIHFLQGNYEFLVNEFLGTEDALNIKLTGAGIGATVVTVADSVASESIIDIQGAANLQTVTFEDLTFDGNAAGGATQSQGCIGVAFSTNADVYLTRVEARNSSGAGVGGPTGVAENRSGNDWHLTDCDIHNNAVGLGLHGSNSRLENTRIHDNTGKGFTAVVGSTHILIGCTVADNGSTGIDSHEGLLSGAEFIIVGCLIETNGSHGIDIGGITPPPAVVVGNIIRNNVGNSVLAPNDSVVNANVIYDNGTDQPSPVSDRTPQAVTFSKTGVLAAGTIGTLKFVSPRGGIVVGIQAAVGSSPTGADLIVDVNKNAVTLFTTQAERPTITDGGSVSATTVPDITSIAVGDSFTVDVDQIGSTDPGSDLTVTIDLEWD